jgi:hypothetical protein
VNSKRFCAKLGAVRMIRLEKKRLEVVNRNRELRILDGTGDLVALNNEFHEIIYHGAHNASIASVTRSFLADACAFSSTSISGPAKPNMLSTNMTRLLRRSSDPTRRAPIRACEINVTGTGLQVVEHFSRKAETRPTHRLQTRRRSSRQTREFMGFGVGHPTTGMPD